MNTALADKLLAAIGNKKYHPLKPKALAKKLGVNEIEYAGYKDMLKVMVRTGKIEIGKRNTVRLALPQQSVVGVFRSRSGGGGWVKPRREMPRSRRLPDIFVKAKHTNNAASGDLVRVHVRTWPRVENESPAGEVVEILERGAKEFVGTYFRRHGEGFVRVDDKQFRDPIYVGDASAKNVADGDKVMVDIVRFPSKATIGEAAIVEVLGKRGEPDVDLATVISQYRLPTEFSEDALAEARQIARLREQEDFEPDRRDLTAQTVITIDPETAHDFDDAIHLKRDEDGNWRLWVHIADVAAYVPEGSAMDEEARKRGTSVYLPGHVVPMLPELISNGWASLQQGKPRLTKTVCIDFDPFGKVTAVDVFRSVICVTRRLNYEQVQHLFDHDEFPADLAVSRPVREMLAEMRDLAHLLRERRRSRGLLELDMPEPILEYDAEHRIIGAHWRHSQEAHRLIEEFMVTANEAVAELLTRRGVRFLRRVHEKPEPLRLNQFADFARSLGLKIGNAQSRFDLQKIVQETVRTPLQPALHYALLRSLREARYSPDTDGHYGLASECYCHFTSPIRRYPDLQVHRAVDRLILEGKKGGDYYALAELGEHCSFTERRAAKAERELTRLKLLQAMEGKVGQEMDMLVTGVEEFGVFATGTDFPAEGLIHQRTLTDDWYEADKQTHSMVGKRTGRRIRLGDRVRCVVVRIDHIHRELHLRLAGTVAQQLGQVTAPPPADGSRRRLKRTATRRLVTAQSAPRRTTKAKRKRKRS